MIAPTTRTGWPPAAGSTGCSATDAPSEPDISATISATVSRVTHNRDHASRSTSRRTANYASLESSSSTRTRAAAFLASNSSISHTIDSASSTVTVGGQRSDNSPINKSAAQHFRAGELYLSSFEALTWRSADSWHSTDRGSVAQ